MKTMKIFKLESINWYIKYFVYYYWFIRPLKFNSIFIGSKIDCKFQWNISIWCEWRKNWFNQRKIVVFASLTRTMESISGHLLIISLLLIQNGTKYFVTMQEKQVFEYFFRNFWMTTFNDKSFNFSKNYIKKVSLTANQAKDATKKYNETIEMFYCSFWFKLNFIY